MNTETNTFEQFALPDFLMQALNKQKISNPTPIQAESLPHTLKGKDILGSAQTGSGKTLAFSIPLLHQIHAQPHKTAIILAPTRELAEQIAKNMQQLLPRQFSLALLIGGAPMFKQLQQLKRDPQIIIGTPGRTIDHLERGKLKLDQTAFLVLDEMDRMLDMGFSDQIKTIIDQMPKERQTLLFSATMPKGIIKAAGQYLNDPVRIQIGETTKPALSVKQAFIDVSPNNKLQTLTHELNTREGSVIVFVKTKMGADRLAYQLNKQRIDSDALHGDLRHGKRQRVIKAFQQKRYRVLVATDVAARGLDIPHIKHVINYDLPQCPEDYVHRIGRTGRGSETGESLCFIAPNEQSKLRAIKRFIGGDDSSSFQPRSGGKKRFNNKRFDSKKRFNSDKSGSSPKRKRFFKKKD